MTLQASFREHHPDQQVFVLIVADLDLQTKAAFEGYGYTPVFVQEIGLRDLRAEAMKYDILELNTNVKPTFLKFLFREYGLDELIYLDPDIFVYAPFTEVYDQLSRANIVLTPHMTTPVNDGKGPSEQEMLYNGTYNLGFIGLRRSQETGRLLDWWEERCLDLGFSEGRTGLFVDQKWMNLAPGFFEGVAVLRHRGYNMGCWNLHDRFLQPAPGGYQLTDGSRLRFFHFSGIVVADPASLSRNTDRYQLADRPDLEQLVKQYKAAVLSNTVAQLEAMPYGFDRLSDGTNVTRLARRIYAMLADRWQAEDPFNASGGFSRFAHRLGLLSGSKAAPKQTWREFNPVDVRVRAVHHLLRWALRLLGPDRYEVLMRYLAHIAVLRNQSVFLREG